MKKIIGLIAFLCIVVSASSPVYVYTKTPLGYFANLNAFVASRTTKPTSFTMGENWVMTGPLTIPATFVFQSVINGAKIYGSTGSAVDIITIKSVFDIPPIQCFDTSITVKFDSGTTKAVLADWFGTGYNKDEIAINRALLSLPTSAGTVFMGSPYRYGKVMLSGSKKYNCSAPIQFYDTSRVMMDVILDGQGAEIFSTSATDIVTFGPLTVNKPVIQSRLINITLYSATATTGIRIDGNQQQMNIFEKIKVGKPYGTRGDNKQGILVTGTSLGTYFNKFQDISLYGWDKDISVGFDWTKVNQKAVTVDTATDVFTTVADHGYLVNDEVFFVGAYLQKKLFTVDTTTDVFTSSSHGYVNGDIIRCREVNYPPSPINRTEWYFAVNCTTNTLKLAATQGGTALNITGTGAGLLYLEKQYTPAGVKPWYRYFIKSTPTTKSFTVAGSYGGTTTNVRSVGNGTVLVGKYARSSVNAGISDANPNANRFIDISVRGFQTFGIFIAQSYGHTFQNVDFDAGIAGAENDIYIGDTSNNIWIEARCESGANACFLEQNVTAKIFPQVQSNPIWVDGLEEHSLHLYAGTNTILAVTALRTGSISSPYGGGVSFSGPTKNVATFGDNGWTREAPVYETAIELPVDDSTPDVSRGNLFICNDSNTKYVTLTELRNGQPGQIITILGRTAVLNPSYITGIIYRSSYMYPNYTWTGKIYRTISLINISGTIWSEISRNDFRYGFYQVDLDSGNAIIPLASKLRLQDTVNSSSSATGALSVNGGVGIAKNLNVGGNVTAKKAISDTLNIGATSSITGITLTGDSLKVTVGGVTKKFVAAP